ncbi:hypothetical protein [Streptomyces turgidiscabies]|uniref:hypothetical protein n=1 Tax=Streptomyces turgidiscabies TaxID=85558 RepID=UPI0038F80CF1
MSDKYQDNVRRILNLMKTTFGSTMKMYYDGDPDEFPPEFDLPALIVSQVSDSTVAGSFGQDDVTDTIVIKILLNKKDDWSAGANPDNMTERKLREYVGARNPETGRFEERTVKGALRTFGTQGIVAIGRETTVEYGITPRANDVVTAEAHVTFPIQYAVDVDEAV